MDIATVIGLVLGFGALIVAFVMEGGNPMGLVNPSAALIVLGGTIATALISFSLKTVLSLPKLFAQSIKSYNMTAGSLIELFVKLADQARREGLLSLEQEVQNIEDDFLRKGVMLVVDGVDPSVVRDILETDTYLVSERHKAGRSMLEAMGGYSPTMGIIGTVMGLVNVLSKLSDPEHLGESIAVAFIATLYGVAFANLVWLPVAGKLKNKTESEMLMREVMVEGVLSVQAGENPRIVREKLESFRAPKERGEAPASTEEA